MKYNVYNINTQNEDWNKNTTVLLICANDPFFFFLTYLGFGLFRKPVEGGE